MRRKNKNKLLEDVRKAELTIPLESDIGKELYNRYWLGKPGRSNAVLNKEQATNRQNYFSPKELPVILNPEYFRIGEIYDRKTSARDWHERLEELAGEIESISRPKSEEDKQFVRQLYHNLQEFADNGYLGNKMKDFRAYRESAERVFGSLQAIGC